MKLLKIFSAMFIATVMVGFVASCSDDDDVTEQVTPPVAESISVSPTSLTFDNEGGSLSVSVTATGEWTVDVPEWVSASATFGEGNATVTLTAESNYSEDGSEERDGVVTFSLTSGEGEATVSVSQSGNDPNGDEDGDDDGNDDDDDGNDDDDDKPEPEPEPDPETISVSPTELKFKNEGESSTVTVTATGAWTVTSTGIDWVTVSPESGDGDATVTVTAESNYSEEGSETRTGTLTFSLTSGDADPVTVSLSQEGNEAVEPEPEPEPEPEEPVEEVVYFSDDFAYLTDDGTLVDIVGDQGTSANSSYNNTNARIDKYKIDGETVQQILTGKGYVVETKDGKVSTNDGVTVTTDNVYTFTHIGYLAFGNNSNTVGIHLPTVTGASGSDNVVLSFDWCPYIGTNNSGNMNSVDTTQLEVEITCGSTTTMLTVPEHEFTVDTGIKWISYEVSLTENGVTVDGDLSIFIRPVDWTTNTSSRRWLLDNLKVYTPGN